MTDTILGNAIDTVIVQNPKMGQIIATLYRVADRAPYTKEHYRLEMVVGGKAHEYTMDSLTAGQARMAQLRAQI